MLSDFLFESFFKHMDFTVDLACIFLHLNAVQFLFIFLEISLCPFSCLFSCVFIGFNSLLNKFYVFLSRLFLQFFIATTNEIHSTIEFFNVSQCPRFTKGKSP